MKNILLILALTFLAFNISCKKNTTSSENTAPTASFTINPTTGTTATTFDFDATGSSDIEDATNVLQVRWDWNNDGTYDTNYSTTKTATHQYATVGTYTVKLEVKDRGGLVNTATQILSIQQQSIVVTFPDSNFEALIRQTLGKPSGDITDADLATITTLRGRYKDITNITGIEYCVNITFLDLYNNGQISDISQLSGLTKLVELYLGQNDITDISALTNMFNLEVLQINNNNINDISLISGFQNLTYLAIGENPLNDFSSITSLTNLEIISITSLQLQNLDIISNLTNLTDIEARKNRITDISVLSNLIALEYLNLSINPIADYSPIAGLINLRNLSLNNNHIIDINFLTNLINLEILDIFYNDISDISAISNLIKLVRLTSGHNQISDISALSNLTELEYLDISMNPAVSNIGALAGLGNLKYLYMYYNDVTDISPLLNLVNLVKLNLKNNAVVDIETLVNNDGINSGDEIWLENNPLSDTSINTYIPALEAREVTVNQ